jgi:probable rRNA maturation factor
MVDGDRRLRVEVAGERGGYSPVRALARWLYRVAPVRARGTVAVAILSDRSVRALNREYRQTDSATDVLSFPDRDAGTGPQRFPLSAPHLGDIVIARGVARRQAREGGHSELTELKVLALHGLLHLLGYDHERDGGLMRRVERRLGRKGGLREGLIGRGHPVPGTRARRRIRVARGAGPGRRHGHG